MADKDEPEDVKVHAPDRTLQSKVGTANLDQILTPQLVEAAQGVIQKSSDEFLEASLAELERLEQSNSALQAAPDDAGRLLPSVINAAFSIKTKAAMGGYDLVSALAKSLHLHCEKFVDKKPVAKDLEIIRWHVTSIQHLLKNQVKGTGGAAGAAIMGEIERLATI